MGWDYHTYETQPAWFLDEISLIMFQEAQVENLRQKRQQSKLKSRRR